MKKKYQKAYDNLGSFGKGIVDFSNKLLGKPGEYAETVASTNPSYRNLKRGTTTTINVDDDRDDDRDDIVVDTGDGTDATSIPGITQGSITGDSGATVEEYDERQETRGTGGPASKSGKNRPDFEDPDTGAGMINKGGLINKPKRKLKKPRGKGLGSK
jgi:hypothetical protein